MCDRGGLVLTAQATVRKLAPFATVRSMLEDHVRRVAELREPDRARAAARTVEAFAGHPTLQDLAARLSPSILPTGAWDERPDGRFGAAIVRALTDLATSWTSAVVCIDDAERLDVASWQVLQDLVRHHHAPVIAVLATGDEAGRALIEREVAPVAVRLIRLEALDERAITVITRDLLGRAADPTVCELIGRRAAGSPLAAVEYCRALIGTGAVQPTWGTATVDLSRVEALPVSADVIDLLLARLDQLGANAQDVLVAAAVAGNEFDLGILAEVAQVPGDAAFDALAEALSLRLVEPAGAGRYRFLHARAQQALLDRISDGDRRRLHTRIGRVLDREPVEDTSQLYGAAWHYACGDDPETLPRLVSTGIAAARAALEERNSPVAHRMMTAAADAAARLGQAFDADDEELFGLICARAGHGGEARHHYERAVDVCTEPVQRARVLIAIAHLETALVQYDVAAERAEHALRLLGRRVPRNPLALAVRVVVSLVGALFNGLGWRFGRAQQDDRQRLELQMDAHSVASMGHSALHRDFPALGHLLMARVPANRLGVCPAYIRLHASLAAVSAVLGFRRPTRRGIDHVRALARAVDDPVLESEVAFLSGIAYECMGEPTAAADSVPHPPRRAGRVARQPSARPGDDVPRLEPVDPRPRRGSRAVAPASQAQHVARQRATLGRHGVARAADRPPPGSPTASRRRARLRHRDHPCGRRLTRLPVDVRHDRHDPAGRGRPHRLPRGAGRVAPPPRLAPAGGGVGAPVLRHQRLRRPHRGRPGQRRRARRRHQAVAGRPPPTAAPAPAAPSPRASGSPSRRPSPP